MGPTISPKEEINQDKQEVITIPQNNQSKGKIGLEIQTKDQAIRINMEIKINTHHSMMRSKRNKEKEGGICIP